MELGFLTELFLKPMQELNTYEELLFVACILVFFGILIIVVELVFGIKQLFKKLIKKH